MKLIRILFAFSICLLSLRAEQSYYWKSAQVDDSAQLLTLFSHDTPLVAALRDKLGSDKITYVWLLTYSKPKLHQRVLSAVPFFYWKVGDGSSKVRKNDIKPLMNIGLPQRSVVSSTFRNVLQWTVLDPLSTPVRASSRAYQNNSHDQERLHLEEAVGYLQSAPVGDGDDQLTEKERDTVVARLDLRKNLLGDFVDSSRASHFGQNANQEQEANRLRNWELLRHCADKTGLEFQPIDLAGTKNQYAILWFRPEQPAPPIGPRLNPVWKLLNIANPYTETNRPTARVPLGVYSLTYPRMPLLMIDFRDGTHLKRHELTQRAINEITSGVIGVSRVTNWYYFVAADLYDFWASHRGTATSQQERLDSYSKFRVALSLDKTMDADLRSAMQKRVYSFSVNPLESTTKKEFQAATKRYELLTAAAANEHSSLYRRLEKDRRSELARFEATKAQQVRADIWHYSSFGLYTRRDQGDDALQRLARYRQIDYYTNFLEGIEASGTPPEVAYDAFRIRSAVAKLSLLLPDVDSASVRQRAEQSMHTLRESSLGGSVSSEALQ